jgi:hypothetical protein
MVIEPCTLSFLVYAENFGDVDLVDGVISVQIVDSGTQEIVLDNDYIVTVPANEEISVNVVFQGYEGEFLVIITLYDGGDYVDGQVHGFTMRYNNPPSKPIISGPSSGKLGVSYWISFVSTDPDGEKLEYYVDFGDGNHQGWLGPYPSGEEQKIQHRWENTGEFTITVKVRDQMSISEETHRLKITKNRAIYLPIHQKMLEIFQKTFPILTQFLGL